MAAKTDMERLGVFSELGYTTVGDRYVPPSSKPFRESADKGKQMMIGGTKTKSAVQAGYFGKTFDRVMQGEAYTDIVKIRRKDRLDQSKKNLGKAWIPSSCTKEPSGVGNYYGCLNGPIASFSAALKPKKKYTSPGRNFLTIPGKKGTGFGYVNVTIGSYAKYASEPFDRAKEMRKKEQEKEKNKMKGGPFKLNGHPDEYFDGNPYKSTKSLPEHKESKPSGEKPKPFKPSSPAKFIGGCKAGTFDPYPSHPEELYGRKLKAPAGKLVGGIFRPSPGVKSMPTQSVIAQRVHRSMNSSNFLTIK